MIRVYIKKWNKKDAPWQRILADVLKCDYHIEEMPEILRDEMGKPYFKEQIFGICKAKTELILFGLTSISTKQKRKFALKT